VAEIELTADTLLVHVKGADRMFALKSELAIPLEHVLGAAKDEEEARRWYHGVRAPGTSLPGVITAGTFYQHGERVFWDVHHPERAIALSLRDESYAKLVVEVEDPDATILAIEAALGARKFS
jgi:TPR repeat protein